MSEVYVRNSGKQKEIDSEIIYLEFGLFFDGTTYLLDNYDLRNDYPNAIIFFEHKAFDIYGRDLAGVANDIVSDNAVIFAETWRKKTTAVHERLWDL